MTSCIKQFAAVLALFTLSYAAFAQADPLLFTVGKTPVTVSEFRYIYAKTNGNKASFTEASLREYLDLYTKFKLKVNRAREMRLDTVPALRDELDGYRKQLANSYLIDRNIVESLVSPRTAGSYSPNPRWSDLRRGRRRWWRYLRGRGRWR